MSRIKRLIKSSMSSFTIRVQEGDITSKITINIPWRRWVCTAPVLVSMSLTDEKGNKE